MASGPTKCERKVSEKVANGERTDQVPAGQAVDADGIIWTSELEEAGKFLWRSLAQQLPAELSGRLTIEFYTPYNRDGWAFRVSYFDHDLFQAKGPTSDEDPQVYRSWEFEVSRFQLLACRGDARKAIEKVRDKMQEAIDTIGTVYIPRFGIANLLKEAQQAVKQARWDAAQEMIADAWVQLEAHLPAHKRKAPEGLA